MSFDQTTAVVETC